ncbi:hypothetical protein DFQ30_003498 [Apophysomyces sp. BC1015]|nr:hypothetical protein DFQ30_003498 [Apophysomyces sp. BC1015]
MPSELQRTVQRHQQRLAEQQQQQRRRDQPWWQYYYQLYHYHPPPGRKPTMFGPYLLLQTLGEGEFGKVKLGIQVQTGHEVAIKLIKKDNIDSSSRMTKIEREISVLRIVRHPYIVSLYDVIETEKYIGIILQCASGGELFEYILAHRYLKEKDASRLFAQLISGVHYMHQKHIVHRDLKLENLLLDRSRSIIITDFGFANQFSSAKDDLMSTSCGSPCYAAPELVISEGMYVGSAVDIWSCGVILYAMLCGYLPFDDDPANPDGDNINLLYKYILNTPLAFPDYVSEEARDLLQKMLVPDPAKRCSMETIMDHPWLRSHRALFEKSINELEMEALHSADLPIHMVISNPQRSLPESADTTRRNTIAAEYTQSKVVADAVAPVEPNITEEDDDAIVPTKEADDTQEEEQQQDMEVDSDEQQKDKIDITPEEPSSPTRDEIPTPEPAPLQTVDPQSRDISAFELPASVHDDDQHQNNTDIIITPATEDKDMECAKAEEDEQPTVQEKKEITPTVPDLPEPSPTPSKKARQSSTGKILHFLSGSNSTTLTPKPSTSRNAKLLNAAISQHHRRPTSMTPDVHTGSILQAKFLSSMQRQQARPMDGAINGPNPSASMSTPNAPVPGTNKQVPRPNVIQPTPTVGTSHPVRGTRRKTLSLLVNSMTDYIGQEDAKRNGASKKTMSFVRRNQRDTLQLPTRMPVTKEQDETAHLPTHIMPSVSEQTMMSSTDKDKHRSAGKKFIDWFKKKPLSTRDWSANRPSQGDVLVANARPTPLPKPLGSYGVDFNDSKLRTHHGAVDQDALTSRPPHEILAEVKQALSTMGIDVKRDSEYKLKCTRRKRHEGTSAAEAAADLDKKRRTSSGTPFRMLLRRASTTPPPPQDEDEPQTIYGDPVVDPGEEVRFSVELCKIKNLPGLYIVDIRRLRGNVWAYKFLYHSLLETLDLSGKGGYMSTRAPQDTNPPPPTNKRISTVSSGGSSSVLDDASKESAPIAL